MLKSVQLKLSKIKYSGDSIGDDIRVEIEILGKFLRVDKKIKAGATAKIDSEVGKFETDQQIFKAEAVITVIEKDILFNDVGSVQSDVEINTSKKFKQLTFKVPIKETHSTSGKSWGTKAAVFEITLEAVVSDAFLYVSFEKGKGGWTIVKLENKNMEIALPAYLKVKLDKQDLKRQYFTILEDPWRDEKASVKLESGGVSYLESTNHQTGPVHLIYYRSKNLLKFGNKTYETQDYKDDPDPWQRKLYDIKIPDHSHDGGRYYLDRADLAMVWFKTTHKSDDRYVHPGSFSLGCVTLTEIERWDELCQILMKSRKGDGESIGFLEVVL
ncbi:hypothetical protein EPN28_00550 [Patescibacteria group bacterium]|nr:MAG: hypothetical protein EPN28_00550 [Patescibacteria group bacterium]